MDLLEERDPEINWLISAIDSDKAKGISSNESDLIKRKEVFGTN